MRRTKPVRVQERSVRLETKHLHVVDLVLGLLLGGEPLLLGHADLVPVEPAPERLLGAADELVEIALALLRLGGGRNGGSILENDLRERGPRNHHEHRGEIGELRHHTPQFEARVLSY